VRRDARESMCGDDDGLQEVVLMFGHMINYIAKLCIFPVRKLDVMTIALAILLLANAAFNVIVWPTFFRRVAKDPRARDAAGRATTFLRVHAILIGIALVIAVVSAVAAIAALLGAW